VDVPAVQREVLDARAVGRPVTAAQIAHDDVADDPQHERER